MDHKATVIDQPDIELVVCRATEFPAGIKDSWERLESKLASLKGRKFYGLTYFEDGHLVYYAGLEPLGAEEIQALGFPTLTLKGGKYARVKLKDWNAHANEIGPIFDKLMEDYEKAPNGPTVEFYRSQTELHLMIPLAES
jgi:predicted transcriptional regulator YdeE